MKHSALFLGLLVAFGVNAQGFTDEPTCYSWNGGHKSAGSFSKCNAELHAHMKPHVPQPAPVAQAAPVQAPPIMMPVCQNPPPASVPLKPKHKPKHRPKPTTRC